MSLHPFRHYPSLWRLASMTLIFSKGPLAAVAIGSSPLIKGHFTMLSFLTLLEGACNIYNSNSCCIIFCIMGITASPYIFYNISTTDLKVLHKSLPALML